MKNLIQLGGATGEMMKLFLPSFVEFNWHLVTLRTREESELGDSVDCRDDVSRNSGAGGQSKSYHGRGGSL